MFLILCCHHLVPLNSFLPYLRMIYLKKKIENVEKLKKIYTSYATDYSIVNVPLIHPTFTYSKLNMDEIKYSVNSS